MHRGFTDPEGQKIKGVMKVGEIPPTGKAESGKAEIQEPEWQ